MKLKLIISGGQTGADLTALECAKEQGIPTGGYCPRGCRTENGPNWGLVRVYNLVETAGNDYKTRTRLNASHSDITVWFGLISPGYYATLDGCVAAGHEFKENPTPAMFRDLCNRYETINVAGNRMSKNPGVVEQVRAAFAALKEA